MVKVDLTGLKIELFLRLREKEQLIWEDKSGKLIPINRMNLKQLVNTINATNFLENKEMDTNLLDIVDETNTL